MRPAEQPPADERDFAAESHRLLVGDRVLIRRNGIDEVPARFVHLADRDQRVPNAAHVIRVAAPQLERPLRVGVGDVELAQPDGEMRKVGVEAGDEAVVIARQERPLLELDCSLKVTADARQLARRDLTLHLPGR